MKSSHFLFKKSPFGIVYHDINGKIIEVNPTAERILQCPEKKLIAKNINNLAHAYLNHEGALISDNDFPWKRIGIDKKQSDGTIIGLQNKDCDDIVWLKVHSIPEYVEEGDSNSLAKVCTMLEDVSDCHNWKMNVLKAANTQKALMSTSKDSTIIIRNGEIIYVNPESLGLMGYREEEVLGKNIADFEPATQLVLRDISKQHTWEQKLAENEKKLNSIVQGSRSAIFTINEQRKFTFINSAGLELFGYPENEVINHDFSLVLDSDSKALVSERFAKRQMGEDVPSQYTFTIVRKNGEKRRVEIYSSVIQDNDNKPVTVANLTDVTEKESRQKLIDEAQNRLMAFFNANDDLMFIKDGSRRYLEGNKAICRFFNKPIEEIIGKKDEELTQPGIIESCNASDSKVIENKEIVYLEEKLGDSIFSVTKFPIEVNDEILVGGILHDITNRKRNEKLQKILLNISQKSTLNISLHQFIAFIHNQIKTIIKAENFYIALYNEKLTQYNFPYYFDKYERVSPLLAYDMEDTITDYVRKSKNGIIVNNENWKTFQTKENIRIKGEHSPCWVWMGAPIINTYSNTVIGVLAVQDYENNQLYSNNDLLVLEIIAGYIGQFISQLQTIDDLRKAKLTAQENENRYKALFNDSASVMLLIDTEDGSIVGANHSATEYYGYSYEEMVAMKINKVNMLSDIEVKLEMQKAFNEERQYFLFNHRLSNGEIRNVEVYSSKVLVNGKPLLYSIVHDITEKKRSEEEIARLSVALRQSPAPIAITDLNGIFIYVNKRYSELSGYSESELIGEHTSILKSGHQSVEFYTNLWNTIIDGKTWEGEIVNKKKNGDLFIEEVNIAPIFNEEGILMNYLKVSRDVTEQREMVKELIAAKEKAEESDRLKTAFLANMSHEIRTPMNGILGFTSLLNESHFSDSDKQIFIESIQKSGDRMLNTVNDIIEISKIEVGEVTLRKKMVNINAKITEIVDFFLPEALEKDLGLDSRLSLDNESAILFTDESKFESIVTNLIKNAIKYSDSGNIEFGYQVGNESLEFYCKDDGIGIPENRVEAIFNRFEQADIDDKRVFQGSGLGLSITKAYVEMLDGKIWVDSVEDKGSVFRFIIPGELSDKSNTTKVNESSIKVEVPVDNELTVLVAEDDEVSLSYLKIILNSKVKKLLFAANGLEAVEAVKNHPEIDIVLMDIQLPVLDGYQATKNIRSFNTKVKIVAQTAYALEGDKDLAFKAGCDDYLSKPINKPALLAILEKYKV